MRVHTLLASLCLAWLAVVAAAGDVPVYSTWHVHLQQPIYWPALNPGSSPPTYQAAGDSIRLKSSQGGHPQNNLVDIFSKADRVGDYQSYVTRAIDTCSDLQDMGIQSSFSGCLIENINSLRGQYGYGQDWSATYRQYVNDPSHTTSTGSPKLDFVAFTYHHALAPLIDKSALAMELAIHKEVWHKTWSNTTRYSPGMFPAEMVFSEEIIPTLVEAGVEWVMVANNHISRACEGYPYSTWGDNNNPPNRADQVNPRQSQWFNRSISRGCTPNNAVPFSFTPHRAKHVDPESGKVSSIVVVPAAMAMSWEDAYSCYSPGADIVPDIAPYANDPKRPPLILMAADGDNAFGGGYSFYMQCISNFAHYGPPIHPTTVQTYLKQFPVPEDDFVKVESGGWVNKDGDFGAPQSIGWRWPPTNSSGGFDIPKGYGVNQRNYAVVTAAQSWVSHASQAQTDAGGPPVRPAQVQQPSAGVLPAELAWHFYLPSLTSGYDYYGAILDLMDKSSVACNQALVYAKQALQGVGGNIKGYSFTDKTAPSIWPLQRMPYNPGGYGAGSLWKYKLTPMPTEFYVWTYVHDISGVAKVTLYYRVDKDGRNPLDCHANELYRHTPEKVGPWQTLSMSSNPVPKGDHGNAHYDFPPTDISDEYFVQVTPQNNTLLDYYVEATDVHGNTAKSDIFHVWVGA